MSSDQNSPGWVSVSELFAALRDEEVALAKRQELLRAWFMSASRSPTHRKDTCCEPRTAPDCREQSRIRGELPPYDADRL